MTASHTRPLESLRSSDEPSFGGKSSGLGELLGAGIPVPPGFALSTAALDEVIAAAELDTASPTIGDAIRAAPLPGAISDELAQRYRELGDAPPVAVRSSAVGEDSAEATFAGQQLTRLWVRGEQELSEAVHDCWASLYSPEAIAYRARLGDRVRPAMGVAVQLMVDAAISGVMFTCNPVSGDPSMVAINASWGLGEAVVGGEVTPDDYLVSKVTGEVVREHIGSKQVQCVARADGRGTELVPVPEQRRELACLEPPALTELIGLARRVERHFGCHQDIEWAIAQSGETVVLQSRPVTGLAQREHSPERPQSALAMVMGTFGVRPPPAGEER